jgi:lysophospholipase L1-like esterase
VGVRGSPFQIFRRSAYVEYDAQLGHAPRGPAVHDMTGWRATITAAGLRGNGRPAPAGAPLLAVGDSFTFGDQVGDAETWPAQLEARLGVAVANGGVSGFGLVRGLLIALIPDDIERCEYARLYAPKPYFEIADGRLVARNVPVPRTLWSRQPLRFMVAHSRLFDFVSGRLLGRGGRLTPVRVHGDGVEVAALLVSRVAELARARAVPALLVVQGPPPGRFADLSRPPTFPRIRRLLDQAEREGLPSLNLVEAAWEKVRVRPERRGELFLGEIGHMSPAGNAWVAAHVADKLTALGWVGAR